METQQEPDDQRPNSKPQPSQQTSLPASRQPDSKLPKAEILGIWFNGLMTATLALVGYLTLSQMQGSFEQSQRGWLTTENARFVTEPAAERVVSLAVEIRNTGSSPVRQIEALTHYLKWQGALPDRWPEPGQELMPGFKVPDSEERSMGTLGPSGTLTLSATDTQVLSPAEFGALTKGTQQIYFFGRVAYRDAFDHPHETRFCFVWRPNPPSGITLCDRWNEVR